MTDEQFMATAGGGILYDASRVSQPGDEMFSRSHWAARGALEEVAGGRSSIAILNVSANAALQFGPSAGPHLQPGAFGSAGDVPGSGASANASSDASSYKWVLRHYRRGGFVAKLSQDSYLWTGAARTRSFAEWRLLAELRRRGLPVPAPIAARYVRGIFTYRADLITELLPSTRTLTDSITGHELDEARWRAIGETIAAFHREGVHHADLNANNILLGSAGEVYILDFDRGRIEARGAWESAVLSRLKRSLQKIRAQRSDVRFGDREWGWLSSAVQGAS